MIGKKDIPESWRPIADEMAAMLSVADAITRRRYPGGCAPAGTTLAVLIALALHVNANKRRRT